MEIYEAGGIRVLDREILGPDDNRTLRVLKLTELNEKIRSAFYNLDEIDSQCSSDFIEGVENLVATILSLPNSERQEVPIPTAP
jgi:hypothetical protein